MAYFFLHFKKIRLFCKTPFFNLPFTMLQKSFADQIAALRTSYYVKYFLAEKLEMLKKNPFFSLSLKNTNLSTSRLEFLSIRVPSLFYVFKKHLFTSTSRYVFILALKNSRPTLLRSVDPRSSIG